MLDFIGFIVENTSLTSDEKTDMLDDFCRAYGYEKTLDNGEEGIIPNPVTKKEFANERINDYIKKVVNTARRTAAEEAIEIKELKL